MKFITVGASREEGQHISRQKFDGTIANGNTKDMSPAERKEMFEMALKQQEKLHHANLRYCLAAEMVLCGSLLGLGYLVTKDSGIGARR